MKYENLAILLTCHSLEDFPVHHEGEDADSLLANWTALWHPQLIADAEKIPTWIQTFEVPEDCAGHLFLCPTTSDSELQTGFAQRVKEDGGRLIRRKTCRKEITEAIFEEVDEKSVKQDIVDDFYSLGYCYLQIQLLTRQLRYSSNLDEVYFSNLVIAASEAATNGNSELAGEKIQAAFDLLLEERDNYYPVNALLIDLTLLAETTLGQSLQLQIDQSDVHSNLLMSASLATQIEESKDLKAAISNQIEAGNLTVVGGTEFETRIPMMSVESVLDDFRRGAEIYQDVLGAKVDFFGRRRYGLATSLPQILEHFGFKGAFHFTLDDGRFPEGMQIKSFWEGDGESRIEVFGKVPLDANAAGNFLNLGVKIGESFDMDHAAAICFVHWPGKTSIWYEDLKRICKFGSVLGKFVSTRQFLEEMDEPYQHDRFSPDQYQSPYFKQAVIRNQQDPISKSVNYWRQTQFFDSIKSLKFLESLFSKKPSTINASDVSRKEIIAAFESSDSNSVVELDEKLKKEEQDSAQRLINSMGGQESDRENQVVFNTESLVQRKSVRLDGNQIPKLEKPIYAVSSLETSEPSSHAVVDIPAMGYATLDSSQNNVAARDKKQLLIDGYSLRNEFVEMIVDPTTGGLRAVHDYKTRGNRLSQVLAFRGKQKDSENYTYASMKADDVETVINTVSLGVIRTRGQLVFGKEKIADFVQEFSLHRGSRVLEVDVEFSNLEAPKSDPWNCYFGSRFAFNDESSLISTTLNQSRQPVSGNRIEAPHYVDLENLKSRTSILTGGVPFHVRRGDRYIDSIYIVKGESCRKFKFGIGVDLSNPLFFANGLIKEPPVVTSQKKLSPEFCWLFHFDTKNVYATSWEPVFEADELVGFRVRVLETMGRESKFKMSCFKDIRSAKRIRSDGSAVADLPVENGKVSIHLSANQLCEIEAKW